jgi:predicted DNA-binding transcriptional regulator YafY
MAESSDASSRSAVPDHQCVASPPNRDDGDASCRAARRIGAHEIQALVLGARIVRQFGDPALARAGAAILEKVAAVVPKDLAPLLAETRLFVPSTISAGKSADAMTLAREALIARRKLELSYENAGGAATKRTVRPLGIFFWGRTWTLAAWCELRQDFRNFRLDRVASSTLLAETFDDEPGKTLRDMLARYGPEAVQLIDS